MTIDENLDLLEQTKDALKASINTVYGDITSGTPFSAYSDSVDNIVGGYVGLLNDSVADYVFPDGVTKVKYRLFFNNLTLTSCTLSDSIQTIEEGAFSYSGIRSINLPDGLVEIGNSAFSSCSSFSGTSGTTVVIPDSVTTIGNGAFYNALYIRTVIVGSGCTSIGSNAFNMGNSESTKLQYLYCYATEPPTVTNSNFLNSSVKPKYIYVPSESVNVYKNTTGWSNYATIIRAMPS